MEMQRSTARARERAGGTPKPVAEEARGPQSGRAQEGRRAPESCPDPLTANAQRLWLVAAIRGTGLAIEKIAASDTSVLTS
jgi:hypothetical protein